jgi:uncharacterized protein YqhQ
MSDEQHFYGGQAIIEGVMMRGKDTWAAAVRRQDDTVVVTRQPVRAFFQKPTWARWPLIRGNFALVEALSLGISSLMFSFNVLVEEETERANAEAEAKHAAAAEAEPEQPTHANPADPGAESPAKQRGKKPPKKHETSGWLVWLSLIPAFALGIVLFILLPAWVPDWLHAGGIGPTAKNGIEAVARIVAIIGYIVVISLMPDVRRVFMYHGAEHATINCFEAGLPVRSDSCIKFGPLHPRCGTSFLLLFIVIKLLLNIPLGWPDLWLRLLLRLAMIIPAAAISYEILRLGGKYRMSWFGRILAAPGMLLQRLTTRQPDEKQLQTAIYALAEVAPEVDLPPSLPQPAYAGMDGKIIEPDTAAGAPLREAMPEAVADNTD